MRFYTVYYAFEEPPALPPTAQADCGKDYTEVREDQSATESTRKK